MTISAGDFTAVGTATASDHGYGTFTMTSAGAWSYNLDNSNTAVQALNAGGTRVSFAEIVTDKGHDAFLLEEPELFAIVRGFLDGAARARGLDVPGRDLT